MGVGVRSKGGTGLSALVLAPLIWLERARGRKRLGLLAAMSLMLAVAGVLGC